MDTVVVTVCCQDSTLAVCSNADWTRCFLGFGGRTGIDKPEMSDLTDHHLTPAPRSATQVSRFLFSLMNLGGNPDM